MGGSSSFGIMSGGGRSQNSAIQKNSMTGAQSMGSNSYSNRGTGLGNRKSYFGSNGNKSNRRNKIVALLFIVAII